MRTLKAFGYLCWNYIGVMAAVWSIAITLIAGVVAFVLDGSEGVVFGAAGCTAVICVVVFGALILLAADFGADYSLEASEYMQWLFRRCRFKGRVAWRVRKLPGYDLSNEQLLSRAEKKLFKDTEALALAHGHNVLQASLIAYSAVGLVKNEKS